MKLNPILSDNMILQAKKPVYIFGIGSGSVTVDISGVTSTFNSSSDKWLVELPAFDYGGPYEMTVNLDGEKKVLKNIYFGDVYLLSGQSNNQFKLRATNTPKEYYTDNASLRLFTVDRLEDQGKHILTDEGWKSVNKNGEFVSMDGEHYESIDGWIMAEKDEVEFWPALGYLLGNILTQDCDRKIGLIACYQGASVIQSWLPEGYLDKTDLFVPIELRSNGARNELYSGWNGDGMLYNGMLSNIIPFALKAVLWYQGESNSNGQDSKTEIYSGILKMLIQKWRKDFNDNELKFIIVQIHDYYVDLNREDSGWSNVQLAQEQVCNTVDNTYLVKSADISETDDIHPVSKLPLAQRISEVVKSFS